MAWHTRLLRWLKPPTINQKKMIPIQIKSIHNHIQFDDNTFIQIISHYSIKLPDVASTGGEEGEEGRMGKRRRRRRRGLRQVIRSVAARWRGRSQSTTRPQPQAIRERNPTRVVSIISYSESINRIKILKILKIIKNSESNQMKISWIFRPM